MLNFASVIKDILFGLPLTPLSVLLALYMYTHYFPQFCEEKKSQALLLGWDSNPQPLQF